MIRQLVHIETAKESKLSIRLVTLVQLLGMFCMQVLTD